MIDVQLRVHCLKPNSHLLLHDCQFSLIPLIPHKRHSEEWPFIKHSAYSHFNILCLWVERHTTKECSNGGGFPLIFPNRLCNSQELTTLECDSIWYIWRLYKTIASGWTNGKHFIYSIADQANDSWRLCHYSDIWDFPVWIRQH